MIKKGEVGSGREKEGILAKGSWRRREGETRRSANDSNERGREGRATKTNLRSVGEKGRRKVVMLGELMS